jgi:chorismate mutase / prephenate dehydratase
MPEDEKLAQLRLEIDDIDKKMVELVSERARLALRVGIAKGGRNIQRPEREREVLGNVTAANKGPLSDEGMQAIFRKIIEVCRTIQYNK